MYDLLLLFNILHFFAGYIWAFLMFLKMNSSIDQKVFFYGDGACFCDVET